MAIKDQCDRCRKQGTDSCTENIVFDSTSCPSYANKIDIEKKEDTVSSTSNVDVFPNSTTETSSSEEQVFVYTKEYLKQNTEIRGWLTFFLVMMLLGGFFSLVYPIATYNSADYAGSFFLSIVDPIQGMMLFGLACYAVYSFHEREPNAVFLAKTYLIVIFLIDLILVFVGEYEDKGPGSLKHLVRSLIYSVIWFAFLVKSTVVEEVIPSEYRKIKHYDYYIIAAIVIVPLLLLALGLKEVYAGQEKKEANFVENVVLNANEYTDGKIIFSCPDGFTCQKREIQEPKIVLYDLEHESLGTLTICSDYDTDENFSNFNSYWVNWEEEDLKKYPKTEVENGVDAISGHQYFIKSTKYELEQGELFWRFVMMFDSTTGKVAVVSSFDGGYDDYLKSFLSTIRFQ